MKKTHNRTRGFTMVEILTVLAVLGILVGISIVGYGAWQNQLAGKEVKSDLTAAATAMEDARNFGTSGYPIVIPSTFKPRDRVTVTYSSGDSKKYCLQGRSTIVTSVYYFIDSSKGRNALQGTCGGGEGSTFDLTILAYDTTLPGCTGNTIQLPVVSPTSAAGSVIDWGDGVTQSLTSTLQSHVYSTGGLKIVTYKGPISAFSTSGINAGQRPCLKELRQWAEGITPSYTLFSNSTNIQFVAEPPASATTGGNMFAGATSFNQNIGNWDTSNWTNTSLMFNGATAFNQDISGWNTGKVTNMSYMFRNASSFNQNISTWNTSKVTDMTFMFGNNTPFNQNISTWNTSKVKDMSYMFYNNPIFNQDLSGWNVSAVTTKPPTGFNTGATGWTLPKPVWT